MGSEDHFITIFNTKKEEKKEKVIQPQVSKHRSDSQDQEQEDD